MRGRPATPTDIKRLKGTFRPDRVKGDEPKIEYVKVPEPPDFLSEVETKYWLKYKEALDILGITGVSDLDAFEMMVTSRADYEVARSAEEKNYKTLIALSKEVRSWMSVFGLTPSSRMLVSKLAGEKKQEVDEVFDFLM